jgi:hypothetical protein
MAVNKKELVLIDKENRVFDLHTQHGLTFETIAKQLGYANRSSAQKAFARALERFGVGDRKERIEAELARLDILTETHWEPAKQGDTKALSAILQVMGMKLDYLKHGAPIRIEAEVINYNGTRSLDEQVEQLARVIEYIEGTTADITTISQQPGESEPSNLEKPSA